MQADLALLLSGFSAQDSANPEQVIAAYVIALQGYPAEAVHDGIVALIRGEAPEHEDGRWLPSTAIVGRVVKRQAATALLAQENQWQRRLVAWQDGRWNPHWGPDPRSSIFSLVCPSHLLDEFARLQGPLPPPERVAIGFDADTAGQTSAGSHD